MVEMNIKNQMFRYHSPSMPGDSKLTEGWFAVSHHFLDKDSCRSRQYYGQWHRISCNGKFVYRCLRLSPNLRKDHECSDIALDWDAWCRLTGGDIGDDSAQISIRTASFLEPLIFGGHPDPSTRTAYQIAFVSLLIAIISLFVAIVSL